jgi:hypothetical protein
MLFKVFEFVDLGAICKSISDLRLLAQNDINRALETHARILEKLLRTQRTAGLSLRRTFQIRPLAPIAIRGELVVLPSSSTCTMSAVILLNYEVSANYEGIGWITGFWPGRRGFR